MYPAFTPRSRASRSARAGLFLLLSSALALAAAERTPNWPRFRGPNGSGLAADDIPAQWTDAHRHWKAKLPGVGHGSPVVWGGRVFVLCGHESGERIAVCLDAATGRVLWQSSHPLTYAVGHKFNSPASSTPAVDAEHVYFSWSSTEKIYVAAFTHDGAPAWNADLGAVKREHGFASSPVVHGDLVILSNDQEKDATLFALDRRTGRIRWSLPRAENHSNYSTPCVFTPPGGAPQIVVSSWRLGVTGVDAATGRQSWQASVFAQGRPERAIGSPIALEDLVIANCAFVNGPKHVVALRPDGKGGMAEAWRVEQTVPHIPSVLATGGRAYLWSDQGIVTCVRLADGTQVWQQRVGRDTFGSPVVAGGRLFAVDKTGAVHVLALGDTFEVLGRNELAELCQSTPAVAGGRMFVRTWEHLHAIGAAR